ncbi:MAG TPA: hypothetical protein VF665_08705 [Longimicrobium sp.]|jgi:hypothetical protein|uniref:hypothetical protein n=1 Tax=Longimicrobium sp. TaxID=2029185 RepID=UPI002ED96D00
MKQQPDQRDERSAVLEDIRIAEQQIAEGRVVDHETAKRIILARFGGRVESALDPMQRKTPAS